MSSAQDSCPCTFDVQEVPLVSHDGTELFGKLTTPRSGGPFPVVVWVQTAEAQTVDTRVMLGDGRVIDYFNLHRQCLAELGIAFFSYEGRGVRMGSAPPRFVQIDRPLFNTSTLDNKVQDAVAAVRTVAQHPSVDPGNVFLMGASEGTLLAAEAATLLPGEVRGLVLKSVVTELREALAFQYTEGMFMAHCLHWDLDQDGVITREEFEADPKGIRRHMPGVEFDMFDPDKDGRYTLEDRRVLSQPVTDAIARGDYDFIYSILKQTAVVELPEGWVQDHFAHAPIWTFLSQLDIPVGIFHGEADMGTPVSGARTLQQMAAEQGKPNLHFHYFSGCGHDLGGAEYFRTGNLSEAHRAMFHFVQRHVR